jgi:recombination protein RecA
MYGEGISKTGDLIDVGVEAGIIEKSGSWYSYNGERIGQGRNNAKEFLMENPDICNAVSVKLKDALGLSGAANQKA